MRRLSVIALVTALGVILSTTVSAQETEVNPLDHVFEFFDAPENQAWTAQFLSDPVPGSGEVTDPVGDFEHSTGGEPGLTPNHLDITEAWTVDFNPGATPFFAPTDESEFWAPTGLNTVNVGTLPLVQTFTGDSIHDGSQYANGAYLFGFEVIDPPPVVVDGRCEYVVWVNDGSLTDTFQANSSFPRDPAHGTNRAFGIGINPEDHGASGTFALEMSKNGGFQPNFDSDIRGFFSGNYIGITAPKDLVGELLGVNFYTFCVREGSFSLDPIDAGADQTSLIEVTDEDIGIVEMQLVSTEPVVVETTVTTDRAPETTTAAAAGEPPTKQDTDPGTTTTEDDGEFPFWLLFGAGGLALVILGWWLYNREDDPCKELLAAWVAAQKACEDAQSTADDLADDCMDKEADLENLEEERKDVCKEWPPACWTTEDGAWVEDEAGNRITSRDQHMRRMALGEVWSDYKAGKLTAQQVEAKWRDADSPEFREDMRDLDEFYKDELADIDQEIEDAKTDLDEACDKAADAQAKADTACDAADAARLAYEACIGAAVAAAGEAAAGATTGGTDGTPAGPSGPSVAGGAPSTTGAKDPCEGVDPMREARPAGRADTISVKVDFSIIIGKYEGSERNVEAGQDLVQNLSDLARDLDFAGDLLSARQAGLAGGGAYNGYAAGKYVSATGGVIRGGIEAATATDIAPDVPTSPVQAGTEFLEKTAELGAFISGKVTEWMGNYEIATFRRSFFYQRITATPYEIWECRTGIGWVCVEKVWEFNIGKLKVLKGHDRWFTMNSSVRRAHFNREVRRMSQAAGNTIKNDAKRLAEWRARHEPGACGS